MSRANKARRAANRAQQERRRPEPTQPPVRPAQNGSALAAEIAEGVKAAAPLAAALNVPEPDGDGDAGRTTVDLVSMWGQARKVKLTYEQAVRELEEREALVVASEQDLDQRQAALARREEAMSARDDELRTREAELDRRAAALDARDQQLLEQQATLEVDRARSREALLADARRELASTVERINAQHRALEAESGRSLSSFEEEMERRRGELEADQARLAEERARLRAWKVKLEAQAEDQADAAQLQRDRVDRAVAAATEHWQIQCRQWEQQHRAARDAADRLEALRDEHEAFRRGLEDREPPEVLADLAELRSVRAELRRLQLTPPDEDRSRLLAMEEQWQAMVDECTTLRADNARLQRQLTAHQITATELERLKVTAEAQDAAVEAYRVTVEDLERRWNGLIKRQEGQSPFPQCTDMDDRYDEPREDLDDVVPPLPELIARIRAIIRQQHEIYYSEEDLRCFLAGLAASRLHLLEGISGIGKTQLPQRFAEAIGASSAIVSVGADWRTPQDLMGYYNAFERRFYESEFTQALYQSQTPRFGSQPFFVVLDEMNLSHPEQYFNDVLSALEADRGALPELVLMNAGVDPAPRQLHDRRKLLVPDNVWFVGTANHDETTVLFADKTYDRAHVLELPGRYEPFSGNAVEPLPPLSAKALGDAFEAAAADHEDDRELVQTFLDGRLQETMAQEFEISWGNRLNRQVARFVPVIRASGGTVLEAADHIVATKILRKLRGRYEVQLKDLQRLHQKLPAIFAELDGSRPPAKSLHLLEWEERRRTGQS